MDIREQLESLRLTVRTIDRKYARPAAPVASVASVSVRKVAESVRGLVEELTAGEVVETPAGRHFEMEKVYAPHHRHGSFYISDLTDMRHDFPEWLSGGAIASAAPGTMAFLDTETTGLNGASGACAFLIGVGSIGAEGFRVRQFFIRDFGEEASALHALTAYLARFDVLVTYNGRTYDQPLLETRYAVNRSRHPFARMAHLDLLHGARRLFKPRLDDCSLMNLENRILGFERENDVPGELIPYCWYEYLRTRRAHRLVGVFHHNAQDIVSLACLTAVIPEAFRDPENVPVRHGADLLGIARWLQAAGRLEEAHRLMRRAVAIGLEDRHLFRTLFDAGMLEKKLGLDDAALATFTDLSLSPNPCRARAYEELSKHYEHREKNYAMALECVQAARELGDSEALGARARRLEARRQRRSRQSRLGLSGRAAR